MLLAALIVADVLLPALLFVANRLGRARISERHHSHHDTYSAPIVFVRSITRAAAAMGALGLGVAYLARLGLLDEDPVALMCFFDGFLVTLCAAWVVVGRYKVSTFSDCMVVTPLLGADVWVSFEKIDRLVRRGGPDDRGHRSLDVYADGVRVICIHGLVDIEQILMRIDRFDVLERTEV